MRAIKFGTQIGKHENITKKISVCKECNVYIVFGNKVYFYSFTIAGQDPLHKNLYCLLVLEKHKNIFHIYNDCVYLIFQL
jgi:hypothetical protein